MAAAPVRFQYLPLAPAVYFEPQSLHKRYCWWYQVLVGKIARLCTNSQSHFNTGNSEHGQAVKKSLERWKEVFKVQFSQEWVASLDEKQLEDIYQELCHLARYLFALNVLRPEREEVANVPAVIAETVSALMHLSAPHLQADSLL